MINGEEVDFNNEETSFAELYSDSIKRIKLGEVVCGKIIDITKDFVLVDIGCKSDGRASLQEFLDENGDPTVNIGDEVDLVLECMEDKDGFASLSKEKADLLKVWDDIVASYEKGKILQGKITKRIKGDFYVEIGGVNAFLPGSQLDIRPVKAPDKFVGESSYFKVLKYDKQKPNIIVSRRVVLEEEMQSLKAETLANLEEGGIVKGTVKNITDYGAFIDLGGVDGLLHITDMSWGKISHPSSVLSPGDIVDLKVLKYDKEDGKISLGLKQTRPDPWIDINERYAVGSRVTGKAVKILDYGAFVELEKGVEGLVHVSEMSWLKIRHPSERLKAGDSVEVVILHVDPANRRVALSLKQLEKNPWELVVEKYPKGSKLKGIVKSITDFGIFIGVEEGIDGLVHISDLSWKKMKHPSEVFEKGQEVEAVVLNIDRQSERFSLGIKQLKKNPWEGIAERYKPGMQVVGKITHIVDFGAFIELEEGIEGLIHVSELNRAKKTGVELKEDEMVEVEILNIDPLEKKIGLGIKSVVSQEESQDD